MKRSIATFILLVMVGATTYAATVEGQLGIKLENIDSHLTLQYG